MKKTTLLKSMLLLCALVVGSGSVWADSETITFSTLGYTNGETVSSVSGSNISIAFTDGSTATAYFTTGTGIRIYGGGSASFTAGAGTVTKVELTFSSDSYAPSNANNWSTTGKTSATSGASATWEGSASSVVITRPSGSGHWRMQSVKVTYTPAAKTDPTITFSPGSVRIGKTLDVSTLFSSNSDGAVTYSITAGDSYATIDGSILTGVAAGNVTVKASQASTVLYNAGEKSTTIEVKDLTLSGIAITTAPTKTTYKEGQPFDATGMVVTATFSDASTDDVTASCTFTPSGALSTSDTKVTVSYTENAVTKTADQAITVSAQSTTITINPNYAWLGVSSGTNIAAKDLPKAIDNDGLTVTFGIDGSTKPRGDSDYIRVYTENPITFTAPAKHFINSIVFTQASVDGTKWTNSFDADEGDWDNSTKTWSCDGDQVDEVTLTCGGTKFISKIVVTLVPYTTITPGKEYTTLTHAKNLDFTGLTTLKAYIAKSVSGDNVNLVPVNKVPAGTGLVLKTTSAGSAVNIPIYAGEGDDTTGNLMLGSATSTTAVAENAGYILKDGKFQPCSGGTLAAGKAYLNMAVTSSHSLELNFEDGGATSIMTVENAKRCTEGYYNLAGQRVAQTTKGLYIVNGKKVIK